MKIFFKKLGKIFIYFILIISLLSAVLVGLGYYYQNTIIALVVTELNKNLNTKVSVSKVDLSFIESFPNVALVFKNVAIEESFDHIPKNKMAVAQKISLSFDFWDFWKKNYQVSKLEIVGGDIILKVDQNGDINFDIFKKSESENSSKVTFKLKNIAIDRTHVSYTDNRKKILFEAYSQKSISKFILNGKNWVANVSGDFETKMINIGDLSFFKNKKITLDSKLKFNDLDQILTLENMLIGVNEAQFITQGLINIDNNFLDVTINQNNNDLKNLLSLLPNKVSEITSKYNIDGNLDFKGRVKGFVTKDKSPKIEVNFSTNKFTIEEPETQSKFDRLSFSGLFLMNENSGTESAFLEINSLKGFLNQRPITLSMKISNLKNPHLLLETKANVLFSDLIKISKNNQVIDPKGEIDLKLNLNANINDLKSNNVEGIKTDGKILFKNLNFGLKSKTWKFRDVEGDFEFDNASLLINQLKGMAGNSSFEIGGYFSSVFPYLFSVDKAISISGELKSNNLDLDQLLDNQTSTVSGDYAFKLPKRTNLDLNCTIGQLKFRRFNPKNIETKINLNDNILKITHTKFNLSGGSVTSDLVLDANQASNMKLEGKTNMNQISIDSVFYIFENFGQKLFTQQNLSGKLQTETKFELNLDSTLKINTQNLKAEVQMNIKNGVLKSFEPLKKMSKFIDESALAEIQFSELTNTFYIQNQMIEIPKMEIKSNINTISLQGTHSFDNVIKYKLKVPIKNYKNKANLQNINHPENDGKGGINLYLTISGKLPDIKIEIDKRAIKEVIKERIQQEKKEFKDLFKSSSSNKTEEEKKPLELKEGEYFDF